MLAFDRSVRLVLLGWALMVLFALLAFLVDTSEVVFSLVLTLLVAAIAAWVRFRPGRPALVVSLIFGVLLVAQQLGYSWGSLEQSDYATLAVDLLGLVGSACVVVGTVIALRTMRGVSATTPGLNG